MKHFQDSEEDYDALEEYESGSIGHHKAKIYREEEQ
jgi:hypothetical protein